MKVLVANRGEIACRVMRTLQEMGIQSVAVYTEPDRNAPHVGLADEAVEIESYLKMDLILGAVNKSRATAIHPGYGFLSQSAPFAKACRDAKVTFIGPSPESMIALGDKRGSRKTAEEHGVPVVPGVRDCDTLDACRRAADTIGYPILIKAAGGGGGKGMRRVDKGHELKDAFEGAKREALSSFGDDRLIVEKYVFPARHVEVQILGNGKDAVALGERECSLQRRYQKIIEESPSLAGNRAKLFESAVRLARATQYENAGTVEFLVGPDGSHYFLEVNTRLQVEHPVTEMLIGMDIVRAQIEVAQGAPLPAAPTPRGHAIEARLNAEDPYREYMPQTGKVLLLDWPTRPGVRVDSGIVQGSEVTSFYDPLLAKIIAWGSDREQARMRLLQALMETTLLGLYTNQSLLVQILQSEFFIKGETFTSTLESKTWNAPEVPPEVLELARQQVKVKRGGETSPWLTLGRWRQ